MHWYNYILTAAICLSAVFSVFYSIRHRRRKEPRLRGLDMARMNISMGLLLIFLALSQVVSYEFTIVRSLIGALFLVLGLFNLFAGLKNRSVFLRDK